MIVTKCSVAYLILNFNSVHVVFKLSKEGSLSKLYPHLSQSPKVKPPFPSDVCRLISALICFAKQKIIKRILSLQLHFISHCTKWAPLHTKIRYENAMNRLTISVKAEVSQKGMFPRENVKNLKVLKQSYVHISFSISDGNL